MRRSASPSRLSWLALCLGLASPVAAGALVGTVHDPGGAPLAGAVVTAYGAEGTAERQERWRSPRPQRVPLAGPSGPLTTTTDTAGRFGLALPAGAFALVEASAPGHVPAQRPVLGGDEEVSFTLERGRSRAGRVTSGGRPAAGATVVWPRREDHHVVATTGPDGGFTLVGPEHGVAGLLVFHPGFAPTLPGREGADPLRVELDPGRRVRGTVRLESGAPAAGAELWVDGLRLGTTGERGEFDLAHVPTEAARLRATMPDRPLLAETSLGGPEAGDEAPLRLVLAPAAAVEGTVRLRTATGRRALAGLPLALVPVGSHVASYSGPPLEVVTDATGAYRSGPLPAGAYAVVVAGSAAQRLRTPLSDVTMEGGVGPHTAALTKGETSRHDLELVLPAEVHGRLLDAAGAGVAGAAISLLPAQESPVHLGFDPELPRSGGDGRFVVSLPWAEAPLQVRLVAARTGHSLVISEPFELAPGARLARDLRVPAETPVEVLVTDPGGAPVPAASVAFVPLEASAMRTTPPAREMLRNRVSTLPASADGRVRLWLAPGEYELAAAAPGYQAGASAVDVSGRPQVVTLRLEPGVEIRGRVVRGGRPVAGVTVVLQTRERRDDPVVTGADGAFRFGELAPGDHTLIAMKHEELVHERRLVSAPAADLVVELPPAGGLVVDVRDDATGAPVAGAVVEIRGEPAGELGRRPLGVGGRSGGRGRESRFDMPSLPVGAVEVIVSAPGYLPGEPRRVEIREEVVAEVAVALSRGATLRGRVTGEDGEPVSGGRLMVAPRRGEAHLPRRVGPPMTHTDVEGRYELSGLPRGELTLVVAAEGLVPHHERLVVAGDAHADFRLSRGLTLFGRVIADGSPVAGARVGASSAALRGQEQSAQTDADGGFTLTGLVPTRYTLSAFREGVGSTHLEGVDPEAGEPVVLDLSPRPTAVVHGVVTGLPAAPRGARVTRRIVSATGTSGGAEAEVLDGGTYRIEGAPTGVVQLRAIVETPGGMWSSRELLVELEPGEERRVDLDLAAPVPVQGQVRLDDRPLGGAYVVFELPGGAPVSTRTGEDGAYAVELPGPGSYRVRVHSESESAAHQQSTHEIDGPRTLDLDLRAREVRGRVVAAGGGEPIAGALVSLRAAGQERAVLRLSETMTGPSGQFVLHGAGEAPVEVVAAAAGFAQGSVAVSADGTTEVVLELEPAEPLRVQVVGAGSEVPLQAHLEVRDASGTPLPARAELLADGTHELTLAPGRYLLTVTVAGHGQRTLTADAPGPLRVEVEPGGDLLLESALVQSDFAGAQVRLRDAAGVEQLPCCELTGWPLLGNGAWLRGLAPGRYAVEVIDGEGRVLGATSATVVAGETTRIALD